MGGRAPRNLGRNFGISHTLSLNTRLLGPWLWKAWARNTNDSSPKTLHINFHTQHKAQELTFASGVTNVYSNKKKSDTRYNSALSCLSRRADLIFHQSGRVKRPLSCETQFLDAGSTPAAKRPQCNRFVNRLGHRQLQALCAG